MKRQALYFGTFNPLHIGHVTVLRYLLGCRSFDSVAIVVSPQSPFKDGLMESASERLENIRKDIARLGLNITVMDTEYHMQPPYYTINTLKKISNSMPGWQQILIMGSDNVRGLQKWYKAEDIMKDYEIWVYPRPGYDETERCRQMGLKLIDDAQQVDISSTEIREKKRSREI